MAWTPIPQEVSLLPVARALGRCYGRFETTAARHIASLGVTPAQFDVLVTLGDTAGLTIKALGAEALISKGTLLPVVERLEARGLVRRRKGEQDARQTIVSLTEAGQALYERIFLPHVAYMAPYFEALTPEERDRLVALLAKLEGAFPPV